MTHLRTKAYDDCGTSTDPTAGRAVPKRGRRHTAGGSRRRRVAFIALPALLFTWLGCSDDGPTGGSTLDAASLTVLLDVAAGDGAGLTNGPMAALARVDAIAARLERGGAVVLDTVVDAALDEPEVRATLRVPVDEAVVEGQLAIRLLFDDATLFRGAAPLVLRAGRSTTAEVTVTPEIHGIVLPDTVARLSAIGATAQLSGAAVFATGDTIPDIAIEWSTPDGDLIELDAAGNVTARAEGSARVYAVAGLFADTATVVVWPEIAAVVVTPGGLLLVPDSTVQLAARLSDANDFDIAGRGVSWSSTDDRVVSVSAGGLARGVAPGAARIVASSGGKADTVEVTVEPAPEPPAELIAPSALAASVADTVATLSWTDESTGEASYHVDRAAGAAGETWASLAALGPDATAYVDETAARDATYRYRVRACAGAECSDASAPVLVRTAPAVPAGLGITVTDSVEWTVRLDWTDASAVEERYIVAWMTPGAASGWADRDTLAAGAESHTIDLDALGEYGFRVRACNAAGCSAATDPVHVTAVAPLQPPSPPAAPTSLAAEAADTLVTLAWTDASEDELTFRIERADGEGGEATWSEIASLDPDTEAYVDSTASRNTAYRYQVRACVVDDICSPYTAVVSVRTAPAAPAGVSLAVTDAATWSIRVEWTDPGAVEDEIIVEWQTPDSPDTWSARDTLPADATSFDDALAANTTYRYRVIACNAAGCSDPSAEVEAGFAPEAPRVRDAAVESVGIDTATFHATVDGVNSGSYTSWWEWATNPDFTLPSSSAPEAGDGVVDRVFTAHALAGGTQYWARLVAENEYGTTNGEVLSFTTEPAIAPHVTTMPVAAVPDTVPWSMELRLASEALNGGDARVYFEYTKTGDFADAVTTADTVFTLADGCSEAAPCEYSVPVFDLLAGDTYQVRAVAVAMGDPALVTHGDVQDYDVPAAQPPFSQFDRLVALVSNDSTLTAELELTGAANGDSTTVQFEVSVTDDFVNQLVCTARSIESPEMTASEFTWSALINMFDLPKRTRYYVRTVARHPDGEPVYSETAWFDSGLTNQAIWPDCDALE